MIVNVTASTLTETMNVPAGATADKEREARHPPRLPRKNYLCYTLPEPWARRVPLGVSMAVAAVGTTESEPLTAPA